ncbi:uncharacterized protein [Prorops nasuta]|uniref:uncharacterized protein n=1 Tax=Prorops nasuta TaxID=863751 RepID=UPI0034CFC023
MKTCVIFTLLFCAVMYTRALNIQESISNVIRCAEEAGINNETVPHWTSGHLEVNPELETRLNCFTGCMMLSDKPVEAYKPDMMAFIGLIAPYVDQKDKEKMEETMNALIDCDSEAKVSNEICEVGEKFSICFQSKINVIYHQLFNPQQSQ